MTFAEAFQQSMSEFFVGIAFLVAVGLGLALKTLWDQRSDGRRP